MLQSSKREIPNFEAWYETKQSQMREDKLLRWAVAARNKIEKQGDLLTNSVLDVELIDWVARSQALAISLPPETKPDEIVPELTSSLKNETFPDTAVLKVSRRWSDSELPDEEILSVLIHVYRSLNDLLLDAHDLLSDEQRENCSFYKNQISSGRELPTEMTEHSFPAVAWFSLQDKRIRKFDHIQERMSREDVERTVKEHYNDFEALQPRLTAESTFREVCEDFFERGKLMLRQDGFHNLIGLVFTKTMMIPITFGTSDRADRTIALEELASQCARRKATSCILVGEVWLSAIDANVGDRPTGEKKEGLSLSGFDKEEGFFSLVEVFERENKKIVFNSEIQTIRDSGPNILAPVAIAIRRAWKPNKD